jgi:hypothetical protein
MRPSGQQLLLLFLLLLLLLLLFLLLLLLLVQLTSAHQPPTQPLALACLAPLLLPMQQRSS